MESGILIGLFILLLLLGTPVAVVLGISAVVVILIFRLGDVVIGQNFYASISSFPLLAIPFFILAGVIFKKAGIARKISNLFTIIVGSMTGGLAIVAVLTSIFWGSLSGSGPATTAAVGLILISSMVKQGYDKHFSAAVIATSADLSIIIPPSIAFIIYGNITSTSIKNLFIAGILPGLLTGLCLIITAYVISRKRGYRGAEIDFSGKKIYTAFKGSFFALIAPVIILGGIYSGIFTPTEAAVVSVFYALFISFFVYKSLTLKDLLDSLIDAAVLTSTIMLIVATAGLFSWVAGRTGIVDTVSNFIINSSSSALGVILLVNIVILGLGMILDAISIMYIIVPVLIPVIDKFHINPVWFGVVFICGLAIGQATPPVGVNLFTAVGLIEGKLDRLSKEAVPFVISAIIALIIISLFPGISLLLTN